MAGVDGDGHRSHGGHGLHQGALLAARNVHKASVVYRVEFGVVVARLEPGRWSCDELCVCDGYERCE